MTSSFLGKEDQDSIDNCSAMIKKLGEIQETVNQIAQAIHLEIKQGVSQRNEDLEDRYFQDLRG
jgi:hypothetical protein